MIIILYIFDLAISPSLRPNNEDDDATTLDQDFFDQVSSHRFLCSKRGTKGIHLSDIQMDEFEALVHQVVNLEEVC